MLNVSTTQANYTIKQYELSTVITHNRFFKRVSLTPSAKLIIRCLIDCWNPDNKLMFPRQEMIADACDMSVRSVEKAIKELKENGLILITKKYNKNAYTFTNEFFALVFKVDNFSPENAKKCARILPEIIAGLPENSAVTYITNKEPININRNENKNLNFNKNKTDYKNDWRNNMTTGITYKDPENTKQAMAETFSVKCGSPLDLPKEEQIEYYNKLPDFAKNGIFGREIKKRWNLQ